MSRRVHFMNWSRTTALSVAAIVCLTMAGDACAELIPTPNFSDHDIPSTRVVEAPSVVWNAVDVGVLLVALSLASYFALVVRSRKYLLWLSVASLLWFGFWRRGCVCPIGATQNVTLATFDGTYVVPISVVAFFVLPLIFTVFFGRTFCASVCPLGAVQELVSVRNVRVPRWLDQALSVIPYVYLGLAVTLAATGTAFVICRYDPFVGFFRLSGNASMMIYGGSLLVVGFFVGRPYCRYLCPYGALLRLTSRVSQWHLRIPPTACIQCRLCEDACPYGAIEEPTESPSVEQLQRERKRLVVLLFMTPFIVGLFAWAATGWRGTLAGWHFDIRLAEALKQEDLGLATEPNTATEAFRGSRRSPEQLYEAAATHRDRFAIAASLLGAYIGLVLWGKVILLTLRRGRQEYTPNKSHCVSCGRCFQHCPVELVRIGLIDNVEQMTHETHEVAT